MKYQIGEIQTRYFHITMCFAIAATIFPFIRLCAEGFEQGIPIHGVFTPEGIPEDPQISKYIANLTGSRMLGRVSSSYIREETDRATFARIQFTNDNPSIFIQVIDERKYVEASGERLLGKLREDMERYSGAGMKALYVLRSFEMPDKDRAAVEAAYKAYTSADSPVKKRETMIDLQHKIHTATGQTYASLDLFNVEENMSQEDMRRYSADLMKEGAQQRADFVISKKQDDVSRTLGVEKSKEATMEVSTLLYRDMDQKTRSAFLKSLSEGNLAGAQKVLVNSGAMSAEKINKLMGIVQSSSRSPEEFARGAAMLQKRLQDAQLDVWMNGEGSAEAETTRRNAGQLRAILGN